MVQKLKRTNKRRLASLSALGVGALGVAASPANANDIVYSGVINAYAPYTIPGPGGAGGDLKYFPGCQVTCFNFSHATYMVSKRGMHGTRFQFLATGPRNSSAKGAPQGAIWTTAVGKATRSADILFTFDGGAPETTFTSTDRYLLFRFEGGALTHDMYGWAQIRITTDAVVDLVDWAYDTSGVQLPAGYYGPSTPEPSTFALTGLAALALGAAGLRGWRAARMRR